MATPVPPFDRLRARWQAQGTTSRSSCEVAAVTESSMEDVARLAGVSVSTVSRALRGSDLVSPETTARVRAAADELSFAISRAASSLATGKLDRVAVLVSGSLGTWFNGTLLDSVYATLHQRRPGTPDLSHPRLGRARRVLRHPAGPAQRGRTDRRLAGADRRPAQPAARTRDAAGLRQPAGPRCRRGVDRRRGRRGGRHPAPAQPRTPADRLRRLGPRGRHPPQLRRIGCPATAR